MRVCNCSKFCCTLLYVHCSIAIILIGKRELVALLNLSSFLSLYTARPSFEYYRQVNFVHSGLQDESLQVTISKLP